MPLGLILALTVAAESPPPYPAEAILSAFATACSGIEDMAVAKASATAAGWIEAEPTADEPMGRMIAFGEKIVEEDPETTPLPGATFRRTVAGRHLYLVVSGARIGDIQSYGCRVYDLAATEGIDADTLENWAVRPPVAVSPVPDGTSKYVWNPGLKPGHIEMEVSFVAPGTALPGLPADLDLSGLILTATALEFKDS